MKIFFSIYRTILFSLIIVYGLVTLLPMLIGFTPYVVLSASMEPEIMTGALCYIDKRDKDVHVGDIVAFTTGKNNETMIVHRINKDNGDGTFVTKGDNNQSVDILNVSKEQIVGTCKFSIPYAGVITQWFKTTPGIICIVSLIAIALISSIFTDSKEALEEEKSKKASANHNKNS